MRQKWIGLALLVLNLFFIPFYSAAGVIGHVVAFIVVGVCVVIILADCRKNDKQYIKKRKENET